MRISSLKELVRSIWGVVGCPQLPIAIAIRSGGAGRCPQQRDSLSTTLIRLNTVFFVNGWAYGTITIRLARESMPCDPYRST